MYKDDGDLVGLDVVEVEHLQRLDGVGGCHFKVSIRTVQAIEGLRDRHRIMSELKVFNQGVSDLLDHLSVGPDSIALFAAKHYNEILRDDIFE